MSKIVSGLSMTHYRSIAEREGLTLREVKYNEILCAGDLLYWVRFEMPSEDSTGWVALDADSPYVGKVLETELPGGRVVMRMEKGIDMTDNAKPAFAGTSAVPCSADIRGEPFTACACSTVKYNPEYLGCGLQRDRWLCVDCGREFIKKPNSELSGQ